MSAIPFYTSAKKDRLVHQLMFQGKLKSNGNPTKESLQKISKKDYDLADHLDLAQKAFNAEFEAKNRFSTIPLLFTTSIRETIFNISQQTQIPLKLIQDGSGVYYHAAPVILKLIEIWSGSSIYITKSFRQAISSPARDIDWMIDTQIKNPDVLCQVIDQGLIQPLAEKFKKTDPNPNWIVFELTRSKKYSDQHPENSYLAKCFDNREVIKHDDLDLHALYLKVNLFTSAADKSQFSLRSFNQHDLFFPIAARLPITHFKALYLKMDLDKAGNIAKMQLGSFLGPFKCMASILNRNLKVITFKKYKEADIFDFASTIAFYVQGARCYQINWFDKILLAVLKEKTRLSCSLAKVVADLLITWCSSHHEEDRAFLVAMTYIASSLLLQKNREYLQEIQLLWSKILSRIDEKFIFEDPLLDAICQFMHQGSFCDLAAQIQLSSHLLQHCVGKQKYQVKPSQTEQKLFTRLKLIPSKLKSQTRFLFFPYDLPQAILDIKNLARLNPEKIQQLQKIHYGMCLGNPLEFEIENSPHVENSFDPRRNLTHCMANVLELLNIKDEAVWKIGYLTACSLLAQKADPVFFKEVLKRYIGVLRSDRFKEEMKDQLIYHFKYAIDDQLIRSGEEKDFIVSLFAINQEPYLSIGWERLRTFEKEDYPTIVQLYQRLLDDCDGSDVKLIRLVMEIAKPGKFLLKTSLQWIINLYLKHVNQLHPKVEKAIIDALIVLLQGADQLSGKISLELSKSISDSATEMIEKQIQKQKDHFQIIRFARELGRLRLFSKDISTFHSSLNPQNNKFIARYLDVHSQYPSDHHKETLKMSLDLLKGSSPAEDALEMVILSLEAFLQIESIWDERYLFMNVLENLLQHELQVISPLLERFHFKHTYLPLELLNFYFEMLEHKQTRLSGSLTQLSIDLVVKTPDAWQAPIVKKSALNLHIWASFSEENHYSLAEGSFLALLHRFSLWTEILQLFDRESQLHCQNAPFAFKILVDALFYRLEFGEDSNLIKRILKNLKDPSIKDPETLEKLASIFESIGNAYIQKGDYLSALDFLNCERRICKEKGKTFYSRAFDLIGNLGWSSQIAQLIEALNPPSGFESSWIEVYKILTRKQELPSVLQILKNKNAIAAISHVEFSKEWSQILTAVLDQSIALSCYEDIESKNHSQVLFAIQDKMIQHCSSLDHTHWMAYIDVACRFRSIESVEIIFEMLQSKNIFKDHSEEIWSWQRVLERLALNGSAHFLKLARFKDKVWKIFKKESLQDQFRIINLLIKGLAKTIEPPLSKNGSKKLINERPLKLLQEGAKEAIAFFESEGAWIETFLDAEGCLNMAKIHWCAGDAQKDNSLYALHSTQMIMEYEPIIVEQVIECFSEFLKFLSPNDSNERVKATISLIHQIQRCAQCNLGPHFSILRYMLQFKDYSVIDYGRQRSIIKIALLAIMEDPWRKSAISKEEKVIVQSAMNIFRRKLYYIDWEVIDRSLKQTTNLKLFFSADYIRDLRKKHSSVTTNTLTFKLQAILANLQEMNLILIDQQCKQGVLIERDIGNRYQFLAAERAIIEKGKSCLKTTAIVIGLAIAFFVYIGLSGVLLSKPKN